MSSYTISDIERLAGLSRARVQGFVDAGFVDPARGPGAELLFSFQDLIVLRAAQGLAAVKIPAKRIKQSLARLRAQLPDTFPMSGERIYRAAIAQLPREPLLHFNLGIALEDLNRPDEAIAAYERALALDPEFADAHYNVSQLHEARGRRQQALRHLSEYRRLLKS